MNRMRPFFLALALSLLGGCFQSDAAKVDVDELKAWVKAAPVLRGELDRTLELTGTVQAIHQVDLVTDIPGKVKQIAVQVGQPVHRGDLLVQLDTDMARLQQQQAEAAVALAQLGFVNATREFQRASTLHDRGSLPDQAFEQVQAGSQAAELQLQQAEAARGLAREQVEGGRLTAPFDGVVTYVAAEEGEYFNPMTISPLAGPGGLAGLVDASAIKIDLQVADSDVARLSVGMRAMILVDALQERLPEGGLVGEVRSIGIAADAASRTFPVRVVADNPDFAVLVGTHARVRLVLDSRPAVLSVPRSAVRGDEDSRYVMVLEGERVRRVQVTVGLEGDGGVEILDGLLDGQQVVVEGNFGLADGALVEVAS
ncbi:MAG: efflux RND transporter periplasmic adaptor subunit [Pseudomonadota bacterium]